MAANEKRISGRTLSLVASDPANPASGVWCRYGTLIGVAVVTATGGLPGPIDFGQAVYTGSVKGENAAGNTAVAAGDVLYYTDGKTYLNKDVSGYAAGTALQAVTTGATALIDVALGRVGAEGSADVPAGSITGSKLAANISIATTGTIVITSASANSFTVGLAGTTNPAFNVDASTASSVTGVNVKSNISGSGVAVSVISSAGAEALNVDAKTTGNINICATSTGFTSLNRGKLAALLIGSTMTAFGTQSPSPTAAQLLGGFIEHTSVTGAGLLTLDTAANIDTAIPGVATGDSFTCKYANIGTQTVTVTTAAGLTLRGTLAVPTLRNATLVFRRTGAGAWTVNVDLHS